MLKLPASGAWTPECQPWALESGDPWSTGDPPVPEGVSLGN